MKIQNMVAVTWSYVNKSGETKKNYTTFGKLFTKDDGSQRGKIETLPVDWDGTFSVYDQKERTEERKEALPF